jgi:hypothetical protein
LITVFYPIENTFVALTELIVRNKNLISLRL